MTLLAHQAGHLQVHEVGTGASATAASASTCRVRAELEPDQVPSSFVCQEGRALGRFWWFDHVPPDSSRSKTGGQTAHARGRGVVAQPRHRRIEEATVRAQPVEHPRARARFDQWVRRHDEPGAFACRLGRAPDAGVADTVPRSIRSWSTLSMTSVAEFFMSAGTQISNNSFLQLVPE